MALHTSMAIIVVIMCLFGGVNQLLVMWAILKKCDWKKNSSLLLIVSLAFCDFVNLVLHAFGGIEAAIGYFITPRLMELILGHVHNMLYGVFCAHLVAMAINRFCGVFYLNYFKIVFSNRRTLITILLCWLFGLVYSCLRFFICCRVIYALVLITFGYDFTYAVDGFVPLSYADNALNALSTIIPTVVYILIAFRLRQVLAYLHFNCFWKKVMHTVLFEESDHVGSGQNSQIDVKLCWQFFFILLAQVLYILTWQLVPRLATDPRYFYFISYASVLNFSINPYIYYIFNKSIRKGAAGFIFGWVPGYHPGTTTVHPISGNGRGPRRTNTGTPGRWAQKTESKPHSLVSTRDQN